MLSCIYCTNQSFNEGKGSSEHVVLSSIGGRKLTKNVCCEKCNNKLGKEIDEKLSEELKFLSTMLGTITGRNRKVGPIKNIYEHNGKNFDFTSEGKLKLSQEYVKKTPLKNSNKSSVIVTADNISKATNRFEQISQKSIDKIDSVVVEKIIINNPRIKGEINLGGQNQSRRSIVKTMLTYAATLISPERLRGGCFKSTIEYINGNNESYDRLMFDTATQFPDRPFVDEINHRVFFVASNEYKKAIGLFEVFGKLRFSTILSNSWSGPSISQGYAIDPVTGEQLNLSIEEPNEIFNSINNRKFNEKLYLEAFKKLFAIFMERQSDRNLC